MRLHGQFILSVVEALNKQGDMLRKKSTANIYAETIKNDQIFGLRRLWSLKDHNNEEATSVKRHCSLFGDFFVENRCEAPTAATWARGNIAGGLSKHTEVFVENGVVPLLVRLLSRWIIGNLVGGTTCLLQTVIDEGLSLFDLMKNKFDIRYEAAWAVYSVSCGSFKQIRYLLHIEVIECVKGLCNLLSFTSDPKLLDVCLNGLNNFLIQGNMLRKKSTANVYAKTIKND
ncbi:unnamed protein product [Vicia faba]|uniref:Uncharacterized protein n=1 Tax=Vicia faba TaxID=3906 RepID=A0AAV0YUA9_VICFA|nr:unnamed protein product [Vicia faba]